MTEVRRGFSFATLAAALLVLPSELSAAERVRLVSHADECRLSEELVTQLRAELEAAGFDVAESAPESAHVRAAPEVFAQVSCEPSAPASISISMRSDAPERRVLRADEGESTHSLVLRVTEFLRARVVQVTAPPRPEPRVARRQVLTAEPATVTYSVELGAASLLHPGGLAFSVAPAVALGVRVMKPLWLDLRASGPFLGSESAGAGSAHFDQELALIGVRYVALEAGAVEAFTSAAVGAFRLGARGEARPPFQSLTSSALSAAFSAGVGASLALAEAGGVALDLGARADALLLTPQPALRIAETAVAEAGQPACALTATVGARW